MNLLDEQQQLDTLPTVFEREALQLLGMLAASDLKIVPANLLEGPHAADVVEYVAEILVRAYCASQCGIVVCGDEDRPQVVKGYAIVFQKGTGPAFLHCCRVVPEYSGDLDLDDMLEDVIETYPELLTLCRSEDVALLERHGFWYAGQTEIPPRHNFLLAQELYGGSVMMARGGKRSLDVPAFMLNDRNLRQIRALAVGQ